MSVDPNHLVLQTSGHNPNHILVIDDEPEVGRIAARILERLGFRVHIATSSQIGIELLSASPMCFAWVLLDWSMPGISGAALLHTLRSIRPNLPIVVMSGYSNQMLSEHIDLAELNAFIQKPFRIDDLRQLALSMS